MAEYGITRQVDTGFEETIERVKDELADHGFGVLSEIDVASKLREKLDVEFDDYRILGACSPRHAHRALEKEQELGLLLPCNVIVYRESGETFVAVIDPVEALDVAENDDLEPIAAEVRDELQSVLASV
ncbi:MAG: DUF302 domain-containing protein [Candidatus Nanohaloarchaea archaeon]|nr:DUF302 domain-containing protein [Candidatus Nanohaloarchaea archaeon]